MKLDQFRENGVTYFRLFASCPECLYQGRSAPRSFWKHSNDNCCGDIYVGDNAYYRCIKCGNLAPVINWTYLCPEHSNSSEYFMKHLALPLFGITSPIENRIAIRGVVVECGFQWLQTFLANVSEQ